jgi:hypothetical protein
MKKSSILLIAISTMLIGSLAIAAEGWSSTMENYLAQEISEKSYFTAMSGGWSVKETPNLQPGYCELIKTMYDGQISISINLAVEPPKVTEDSWIQNSPSLTKIMYLDNPKVQYLVEIINNQDGTITLRDKEVSFNPYPIRHIDHVDVLALTYKAGADYQPTGTVQIELKRYNSNTLIPTLDPKYFDELDKILVEANCSKFIKTNND